MKMNVILVLATLSFSLDVYAQSVMRSNLGSGGSSQIIISGRSAYFVSQSIGQASVIGTSSMIRQGFQHPPALFVIQESVTQNEYLASIYPNPFSQSISVAFAREVTNDITISIHDLSGKVVHYHNYRPAQLIELSLQDFSSGSYMIHVMVGLSRFSTSIIKL
jgi:hypothetical protein